MRLLDFSGRELLRKEQDIVLAANASRVYMALKKEEALAGADPAKVVLAVEITEKGQRLSRNTLSFVKTKDLDLPKPELRLGVEPRADGTFAVNVTARQFARNVYLTTNSAAMAGSAATVDGVFDDNYFDLLPGETATVSFRPGAGTTVEALRAVLRAVTIAETY